MMEITEIIHSKDFELNTLDSDLFIAASGYESRAVSITKKLMLESLDRVVIGFEEHQKELSRKENDAFFLERDFKFLYSSGMIEPDFNALFSKYDQENLTVIVDISVMTKVWYHALLKYFYHSRKFKQVNLKVIYNPASYSTPKKVKRVTLSSFELVERKRQTPNDNKPTALVMGLGVEQQLAQLVHEQVNPERTFLLYADPSAQQEYVENLFVSNHNLINNISIRDLSPYNVKDTQEIYDRLVEIILPLRQHFRVVIVPQGPKIFSLMAMVFRISYPDIQLFYPQFKSRHLVDRKPMDDLTMMELVFEADH